DRWRPDRPIRGRREGIPGGDRPRHADLLARPPSSAPAEPAASPSERGYTPVMGRELPMFTPPAGGHDHGAHEPPTIAMGGGLCAVKTGRLTWFGEAGPRRVAEAIAELGLEHVVVTSVARDDLPDGGAHVLADTIRRLREACPGMGVEVLVPDFNGEEAPLR